MLDVTHRALVALAVLVAAAGCASSGSAGGSASVGGESRPKDIPTLSMGDIALGTLEPIEPVAGSVQPDGDGGGGGPADGDTGVTPGTDEPAAAAGTGAVTPGEGAVDGVFQVPLVPPGQAGKTNGWQVTVHSLTDPLAPASEFITPGEGRRYVAFDVEVVNLEDTSRTFSSSFSLDLLLPDGTQEEVTVGTLHEPSAPSGEMKPGQTFRGLVVFELPNAVDPATGALVLGFNFSIADPLYFAVPAAS